MLQVKLPKLNGSSPEEYWAFRSRFEQEVLCTSIPPQVKRYITHCMGLPKKEGLKTALKILDTKYGDKNLYMSRIEVELTSGPHVREGDHEVISEVCLNLTSHIHFAKKIGKLSHIDNPHVVRSLVDRMDDRLQSKWHAIWTGKKRSKIPRLKNVKKFLQKEMDAARSRRAHNPLAFSKTQFRDAKRGREVKIVDTIPRRAFTSVPKQQTRDVGLFTKTNVEPWKRGDQCRLCTEPHPIFMCPVFKSLSLEHRKNVVTAQRRCFICLRDNHLYKECKAKPCDINGCGGKHSRWLHDTQSASQNNGENERLGQTVEATASQQQ
ncbi:uncharacterized protein LOC119583018 [Penaeus monodon]|uniref:uncharacterized protein LOC119583018 n=1 Tax=Penaeus monodon TaxID=6687 RepID=UPI0018A75583|nr:uncharacterized protein LOC119583018 [Penaeus monodon]